MTDARYYEIDSLLRAADEQDGPVDIFAGFTARPHYDATRAFLSAQERAEYDAFDRRSLKLGTPTDVKDRICAQYPHFAAMYLFDRQFAVNACRLAAAPDVDAKEYWHLAGVAEGRKWAGNPADYDAAQ